MLSKSILLSRWDFKAARKACCRYSRHKPDLEARHERRVKGERF